VECPQHTVLTLLGWRVEALHDRPNARGLAWALPHRSEKIGLAEALLATSSCIIGLAQSSFHCPDIIGLTGALLLRPDIIMVAAGALHVLHRPGMHRSSAELNAQCSIDLASVL
jgi:hypothetical protein